MNTSTYEKIIEALGEAIEIAAHRPRPGHEPVHIRAVRASPFNFGPDVRTVVTLPPGWLPPKEVQPLIKAVHKIVDMASLAAFPPHMTSPIYEIGNLAHTLVSSLRRSEVHVQNVIGDSVIREIWPAVIASRFEGLERTIAKQEQDLVRGGLEALKQRAKFDRLRARVASLIKTQKSGIVPADPRDFPATPPRDLQEPGNWKDRPRFRRNLKQRARKRAAARTRRKDP